MLIQLPGVTPLDQSKTFNLAIQTAQVQPKEEPKTIQYKVAEGDTLTKIAEKYKTTWLRLWQKNTNLNNQNVLNVNETINIPAVDEVLAERPLYRVIVPIVQTNGLEPIKNTPRQVSVPGNGYDYASCTYGVKSWKPEVGNWGNAKSWGYAAKAEGWTVSGTPVVGAVAWSTRGSYGHVALVLAVKGNTITIREQNWDWNGSIRVIDVPTSSYQYIYK